MPDLPPDADLDSQLENTVADFSNLQADLNYQQAQTVLRELVSKLDLSPRERSGLETELTSLQTLLDKLDRQVVQIAVFGMVGRGKSSLLNALLGQEVFETGAIHGVTQTIQTAQWSAKQETLGGGDLWRVSLFGMGNSQVELIDTPGIDEVNGEMREAMARQLAKAGGSDSVFVVAGDITRVEF